METNPHPSFSPDLTDNKFLPTELLQSLHSCEEFDVLFESEEAHSFNNPANEKQENTDFSKQEKTTNKKLRQINSIPKNSNAKTRNFSLPEILEEKGSIDWESPLVDKSGVHRKSIKMLSQQLIPIVFSSTDKKVKNNQIQKKKEGFWEIFVFKNNEQAKTQKILLPLFEIKEKEQICQKNELNSKLERENISKNQIQTINIKKKQKLDESFRKSFSFKKGKSTPLVLELPKCKNGLKLLYSTEQEHEIQKEKFKTQLLKNCSVLEKSVYYHHPLILSSNIKDKGKSQKDSLNLLSENIFQIEKNAQNIIKNIENVTPTNLNKFIKRKHVFDINKTSNNVIDNEVVLYSRNEHLISDTDKNHKHNKTEIERLLEKELENHFKQKMSEKKEFIKQKTQKLEKIKIDKKIKDLTKEKIISHDFSFEIKQKDKNSCLFKKHTTENFAKVEKKSNYEKINEISNSTNYFHTLKIKKDKIFIKSTNCFEENEKEENNKAKNKMLNLKIDLNSMKTSLTFKRKFETGNFKEKISKFREKIVFKSFYVKNSIGCSNQLKLKSINSGNTTQRKALDSKPISNNFGMFTKRKINSKKKLDFVNSYMSKKSFIKTSSRMTIRNDFQPIFEIKNIL